ncbi:MAG: GTPase ObgE [Brevinema sp.]
MIFKDEVEIFISSGKGGDGAVSFRREKFIPNGGPDGGDGGNGGSVIFHVNTQLHTLAKFHEGQKFRAEAGKNGDGQKCFGRKGEDIILEVPPGTIVSEILEDGTSKFIADLRYGEHTILNGGRGGKGNIHYKTAVRQSPQYAQKGTPGEQKNIVLELKLIAHIGLAGFPNAGKSSLVSCLTNARPKVADYPFTTLVPNLGMMIPEYYGDGLLVADIPGLIEGAAHGKGLGIEFLKHIERTKLLLFVLDLTDSPEEKFNILRQELAFYSQKLSQRSYVVCFNKIDLIPEIPQEITNFINSLESQGVPVFITSAGTGEGLALLKTKLFQIWNDLPKNEDEDAMEVPKDSFDDFTKGLDL